MILASEDEERCGKICTGFEQREFGNETGIGRMR
jgi:hypothetical protein